MKILFLSINNSWIPHFETELELMSDFLEQGHDVYVLTCASSLPTCTSNPENIKTGCMRCRSRFAQGIQKIKLPEGNVFFLNKKIKNFIIPEQFDSVKALKNFTVGNTPFGLYAASSLISELHETDIDTKLHKKKIHKNLHTSIMVYQSVIETLEKIKPDCMYIFNGRFADTGPAIAACQQLRVPFYTHERGGKIATYSLFKNCGPHNALAQIEHEIHEFWFKSPASRIQVAEQWFKNRRNGAEQAWFSFVRNQKRDLLPVDFDKTRMNIALFNTAQEEHETFTEWREPIYGDEATALTKIVTHFLSSPHVMFYFRVHPSLRGLNNSQIKKLKAIQAFGYSNLVFIWPEEIIDTYALLEACDKTITFASTVGVEACFWGKPSILVGRAFYESLDCCYIPKTHEEVVELLSSDLAPKDKLGALKYSYWEENRGIQFKKFQPTGLFKGAFLGEEIKPKFGLKDRLLFRFYNKYEQWKQ